jgi:DNA polymerase-3 subunit gamma/tau
VSDDKQATAQTGTASGDDAQPYRVLARKYRPQTFEDLIGQDAMVRTLTNAVETGRIAQAYMLTGVRGVGKTTTARLIARALNYATGGADDGPSITMPELGEHCAAIMESRHVDVIEMDAASNTGIDDVREIIEAVRYRPASARYKVYIIDEVHMLSKAAFNGLLKTLEEPPPHVKFIFATTEVRKVPVTVLSRCQRFDLRRIDARLLISHFGNIAQTEGASASEDALALIARAAEGSVRDGLSLLDQAIALAGETISVDQVRAMLGLVDRARTIDLLDLVMRGDAAGALREFQSQYDAGADPMVVLSDVAQLVHWLTRLKLVETAVDDPSMSEAERTRGAEMAGQLSMRVIARAWQMLLKGISEVQMAHNPMAAAEMVLVRLCYVADLPAPEELVRSLTADAPAAPPQRASDAPPPASDHASPPPLRSQSSPGSGGAAPSARLVEDAPPLREPETPPPLLEPEPAPRLQAFADVVALAGDRRDIRLKTALERSVRPVRFETGHIEIALVDGANPRIINELSSRLSEWTGERWVVSLSREEGERTVLEEARDEKDALFAQARKDPVVDAVLKKFPGARIAEVHANFDTDEANAHMDDEDYDAE